MNNPDGDDQRKSRSRVWKTNLIVPDHKKRSQTITQSSPKKQEVSLSPDIECNHKVHVRKEHCSASLHPMKGYIQEMSYQYNESRAIEQQELEKLKTPMQKACETKMTGSSLGSQSPDYLYGGRRY